MAAAFHPQEPFPSSSHSEATTLNGDATVSPFCDENSILARFPKSIPPTSPARTLVLCFDGTGDQFDSDNSNIVGLFSMLKRDDRDKQMVYYQAGIGTYTSPQIATPMAAKISKALDEAVAWNLSTHVMDGYEFLMQNYKVGDRICMFGFSRGAYTARGLAGMLHKVGLLPACNHQQVPFAYKMYTRADDVGWKQSNIFKKTFAIDVAIEFIGVWDTVVSVGLIPHRLPFTTSNTIVNTFRHAVALDERRAKFKANLWNRPNDYETALGCDGQKPNISEPQPIAHGRNQRVGKEEVLIALERKYSGKRECPTDIVEVWFSGCHCDVGGGSVDNDTLHTLARIPLRWMVRECFKTETGIQFISEGLRTLGLDPETLYPQVEPRPPPLSAVNQIIKCIPHVTEKKLSKLVNSNIARLSEEEHELRDALSPIYDQLSLAWFWWLLEYIPLRQLIQRDDDTWDSKVSMNRGHGREISQQEAHKIKIHRSVKMRMEAHYSDCSKYEPKACFKKALEYGNIEWVD